MANEITVTYEGSGRFVILSRVGNKISFSTNNGTYLFESTDNLRKINRLINTYLRQNISISLVGLGRCLADLFPSFAPQFESHKNESCTFAFSGTPSHEAIEEMFHQIMTFDAYEPIKRSLFKDVDDPHKYIERALKYVK